MSHEKQEVVYQNSTASLFQGLLIGGLAGATAMFLLAPQSGKQTRMQIQEKSIELRDQTNDMIESALSQVSVEAKKIKAEGLTKATELLHMGQDRVAEQLDHVSEAALAGKSAIQNSDTQM
jgi:gas vesicle protein